MEIEDAPRFAWRGFMLDVSRHFFNPDEIKRVLDLMALHKLNVFHWHLTDDQGWRIEIKRYPRLTQVGAWRRTIGFGLNPKDSTAYGPDGRYGGFYTQDEIRDIVAYASARHITIVPEIEMPGHSSAALLAYPALACSGQPDPTRPADVYCAGKEETFEFLEEVLDEVCELFPGQDIHIGADEVSKRSWSDCPLCRARMQREGLKTPEQLQAYFVRRISQFLSSKGRRVIGWSEMREGGLPENAALMDWVGGGAEAATQGHPVVMSPNTDCYFDYYQSRNRDAEPPAAGAFLPLETVYAFEPIPPELDSRWQTNILGAQANLWTEYIPSLKQVEVHDVPPPLRALRGALVSARRTKPGRFRPEVKGAFAAAGSARRQLPAAAGFAELMKLPAPVPRGGSGVLCQWGSSFRTNRTRSKSSAVRSRPAG